MIDTSSVTYFTGAWLVILGSIWVMSKFEGTRTLLYYLFWLGIVLDIVVHYDILVSYFATLGFLQPTPDNGAGPDPFPSPQQKIGQGGTGQTQKQQQGQSQKFKQG